MFCYITDRHFFPLMCCSTGLTSAIISNVNHPKWFGWKYCFVTFKMNFFWRRRNFQLPWPHSVIEAWNVHHLTVVKYFHTELRKLIIYSTSPKRRTAFTSIQSFYCLHISIVATALCRTNLVDLIFYTIYCAWWNVFSAVWCQIC